MTHPKRPRDPNQLAKSIIDIATGSSKTRLSGLPSELRVVQKAGLAGRLT